jgi:hypothetical protein
MVSIARGFPLDAMGSIIFAKRLEAPCHGGVTLRLAQSAVVSFFSNPKTRPVFSVVAWWRPE